MHPTQKVPTEAARDDTSTDPVRQPRRRFWIMLPPALLAVAWQVWSALDTEPSTFLLAYWNITWDHGFIRRGLLGEINQLVFPNDTLSGARTLIVITAVASAAIPVGVALALLHRGTTATVALGWLIILSPFTVKGLFVAARPDQLPILLVVVAAWGLSRWRRHRLLLLAGISAAFAAAILTHEGIVLTIAPWLLLVIVWFSRDLGWRVVGIRAATCFALPALVTLMVVWRGGATTKQIRLLSADTGGAIPRRTLQYLGDSMSDSVALVASIGRASMVSMFLVGLALWAAHLVAVGMIPGLRRRPPKPVALVLAGAVAPAFVIQLVIAVDWQRWFALWGAMGLLTLGLVLLTDRSLVAGHVSQPWPPRPLVVFVLVATLLFLVPKGAATGRYPCTFQYIPHEASYPYERALDVILGTHTEYRYLGHCKRR